MAVCIAVHYIRIAAKLCLWVSGPFLVLAVGTTLVNKTGRTQFGRATDVGVYINLKARLNLPTATLKPRFRLVVVRLRPREGG